MKTIKIYGASDDLVEVDGKNKGCDEFNASSGKGIHVGTVRLHDGKRCVNVHCIYDGSWAFAVCPQDGNYDSMPWAVSYSFGKDTAYSQTVEISVPDDCVVSFVEI